MATSTDVLTGKLDQMAANLIDTRLQIGNAIIYGIKEAGDESAASRLAAHGLSIAEREAAAIQRQFITDAIGLFAEQRRCEDNKRRTERSEFAAGEANRAALAESNRDAAAHELQKTEAALRVLDAEIAERRSCALMAEVRRVVRWTQIVQALFLLALFLFMALQGKAQEKDSLVIQFQDHGAIS